MEPTNPKTPDFNVHASAYLDLAQQITAEVSSKRTSQLDLQPSSVNTRAIGNVVGSSHSGLGNASFDSVLVPANSTVQTNFYLDDSLSRTVDASPDISVYMQATVPADTTAEKQWPTSAYGLSSFPWIWYNNWGLSDNVGVVTSVALRNNTSSDVPVVVAVRWRIIKNAAAQLEQS